MRTTVLNDDSMSLFHPFSTAKKCVRHALKVSIVLLNLLHEIVMISSLISSLVTAGKESACNVGDVGSIPGLGRSPGEGKGYPHQYSGLENSMDCIVHGVAKSGIQLRDFHYHLYNLFSQLHFPLLLFIIHFNLLKNFLLSAMSFLFPKSLISVYTNSKLLFTWSSQIYTLYNFLSVLHCLPFCPTLSNTFCPTILFCSFIFFLSSHLYSYVFLPQSLFPTDSLFIICIHSILPMTFSHKWNLSIIDQLTGYLSINQV